MTQLPFTISADAQSWIVSRVKLREQYPQFSGLVPVLSFAYSCRATDREGRLVELYSHPYCFVGYQRPDVVADEAYRAIEILGLRVFVHDGTIEEYLRGKRLILDVVEVGYSNPSTKTMHVLKAV